MSDLISRSALIEEIERQKSSLDKDCEWSYNMTLRIVDIFFELINKQPTVEAKPVVNGEWIENTAGHYVCSNCRQLAKGDMTGCFKNGKFRQERTNFCPNCGADMRGGKNE